jgi:endonuclease/exonuclease/phosphatase family metal-dependent hydrolase
MTVSIPVVPQKEALVKELTVLSFNMWFGGTQVKDYHAKQVRFITNSGADIVGLQESTGGHAIRLAKAMGWDYWQGNDVGVISRYPMVKRYEPVEAAGAVRIALDSEHEINFWNCHLGYTPYGPYDFCFDHMSPEQVLKNEAKSRRTPQIVNIMKRMENHLASSSSIPVIFTGDFNAPSHLDWINATKKLHCGVGYFPWPTSKYPVDAGMVDSFREVHSDPMAEPGITWSPIYLDNNGRTEPKDRIDFIYHKGLKTQSSEAIVVGNPRPQPDHYRNEWPSDHAAVKTVFKVEKNSFVEKGNSRVLWGVVSAIIAVTAACASWIVYACVGKRKPNKRVQEEKDKKGSDSGETSGDASA